MSAEKPKPTAQPKPTSTPKPPEHEPKPGETIQQPIGDPPDPESWQARTQPDKPFETAEDRERVEKTPPEDLDFSAPQPSKKEQADAEKVEADAQPFERPAPPQDNPASPPAGEKETKA